jgi:hypothetical protein
MCNGANLAYARTAFYEVEGFKGIDSLPSGDDMLLMHKIYRKYPDGVFFLKSPKSHRHDKTGDPLERIFQSTDPLGQQGRSI